MSSKKILYRKRLTIKSYEKKGGLRSMVRKYDRAPCAPDGLRCSKPVQLSKLTYVLSLIVSSILGCSHSKQIRADKPYYVTTVVQHKPFAEGQRKALIADILPRLQGAKLFAQRPQKQKRIPIKTETLHQNPPRRTGCDMDYSHAIRARDRSGHLGQAHEKVCSCSSILGRA